MSELEDLRRCVSEKNEMLAFYRERIEKLERDFVRLPKDSDNAANQLAMEVALRIAAEDFKKSEDELNATKDQLAMWKNAAHEHKHRADNLQEELDKLKSRVA